ncbi:MAG: hypothetical protein IJ660_07975 [Alphaproteobacteria bacterium]|nr:hypothetical protein [Alphaproteobacteria bacterium]
MIEKVNNNTNSPSSTALTVINQQSRALSIPSNATALSNFVKTNNFLLTNAQKLLQNINPTAQSYLAAHKNAQKLGFTVLDAALILIAKINAIPTAQGNHNPNIQTKAQILKQVFNLTVKQAWRLCQLTDEAVRKEKEYALKYDEIPTISHALKYVTAQENAIKRQQKREKIAEARINAEKKTLPNETHDLIWADTNTIVNTPNIKDMTPDNAIIFILCEKAEVTQVIDAIHNQKFEYVDQAVIIKTKMQKGSRKCFQNFHKCLLVGIKGNYDSPFSYQAPSVIYETNMQGVDETTYCQGIIEQMYPDAAYLDLVSDTPINNRWDVCDNSMEN